MRAEKVIDKDQSIRGWQSRRSGGLRTTNQLERLNKELKRWTRVATLFPNEASLLRLAGAVLIETSEDWETGKIYLTLETK